MPPRPTAQQHHWTIRLAGHRHLFELDQPPRLETRPQLVDVKRLVSPRRRTTRGRAAGILPARLVHRLLQLDPIELAIAQEHHLRPRRDQLAHQLNQGDVNSVLKFFQVDNAGMLRMTSSARYFKEGVGSSRPSWRWIMCFLERPKANTSCRALVKC